MQNIKEGDSVIIDSDSFDINGKIAIITSVDYERNRCIAITEEGESYHLPIHSVTPRRFLTENQ